MSYQGNDDDIEINHETEIVWSLEDVANQVRAKLLQQVRGLGNLFGPTAAQKKTPLASKPQSPGTQRIF